LLRAALEQSPRYVAAQVCLGWDDKRDDLGRNPRQALPYRREVFIWGYVKDLLVPILIVTGRFLIYCHSYFCLLIYTLLNLVR